MKRSAFALLAFLASASAFALPPDFHKVTRNIYRGGRPTGDDLRELAALGFDSIVNLENDPIVVRIEAGLAAALHMKFVNIPLSAGEIPEDAAIDDAIDQLAHVRSGKTFVHCQRGKDRTGVVVALYRTENQGWKPRNAYDEMMNLGFSLKYAKPLEVYFRQRTGLR